MPDANPSTFRDNDPVRPEKPERSTSPRKRKRAIVQALRSSVRACVRVSVVGCAVFLLCHCHRQSSTAMPPATATPTTPLPTPAPAAEVAPTPTATAEASAPPLPVPSASETPDTFG